MAASKRIDGPTPQGGAYAVAYFRDDDLRLVEKEAATLLELIEYDDEDQVLFSTYLPLVKDEEEE